MARLTLEERVELKLVHQSTWDGQVKGQLRVEQLDLARANQWVLTYHRHCGPVAGHKFSLRVYDQTGATKGVCIVGRPVSRVLDDGKTLEVLRLVTAGAPHACSKLYAAARRLANKHGYPRLVTYTRSDEPGTSLRAAGWQPVAHSPGGHWDCAARPRERAENDVPKVRWEAPAPNRRIPSEPVPFPRAHMNDHDRIVFDLSGDRPRIREYPAGKAEPRDPSDVRLCAAILRYLVATGRAPGGRYQDQVMEA